MFSDPSKGLLKSVMFVYPEGVRDNIFYNDLLKNTQIQ